MNKEQINILRNLAIKELTRTKEQFDAKQDHIIKGAIVELDILEYQIKECREVSTDEIFNQKANNSLSTKSDPRLWKH